jgi:peptidoglycan hydrolase-like protein with peptidoglycan-binding domain
VDGVLGAATIRRWQTYLNGHGAKPHLDVDGQLGPATWRAVDVWLGVTPANGVPGRDTVRALQRKVGSPADGILGADTIRALQRWLNNHR